MSMNSSVSVCNPFSCSKAKDTGYTHTMGQREHAVCPVVRYTAAAASAAVADINNNNNMSY
jgi:hypothetical protein